MIDLKELIKAGVHFGHQTWRWCPKMSPYIWGAKNGIHLIDVAKTAHQIEKAAKFLEGVAATGRPILWVGTKSSAQKAILEIAGKLKSPSVTHRWIGGTLTNYIQVKKSVTKLLHYEDVLTKADDYLYTKKELGLFQKMVGRHQKNVGGIRSLTWPVGAIVVVDVKKEFTAIREAASAGVPVVALVDTNSDPSFIDYVIPANDDIPRSIETVLKPLAEAVARGQVAAASRPAEEIAEALNIDKMIEQALLGEEEGGAKPQQRRSRGGGRNNNRRQGPGGNRGGRPEGRGEPAPKNAAE